MKFEFWAQACLRFMAEGSRIDTMRGQLRIGAVLLAAFMFVGSAPVAAQDDTHWLSGSDQLTFYQEQGLTVNQTLSLNGTSNQALQDASWALVNITLFDQYDVITHGDYLSSVIPSGENRWSWTLVIDVEGIDCTCVLEVHASSDLDHQPALFHTYLGESGHRPLLMEHAESIHLLTEGVMDLGFDALTPLGTVNGSMITAHICEAPNDVCLVEATPFKLDARMEKEGFHVTLNATALQLPDGFWKFELEMEDLMLRPSNPISFLLHLDRQAPLVSLSNSIATAEMTDQLSSLSDSVMEDTEVLFTAVVTDGYAGESEVLTWSKVSPSGVQTTFDNSSFVSEASVFFVPSEAGEWTVSLLVRDSAGHLVRTTTTLLVVNEDPTAVVTLDGLTVSDGDQLTIPTGTAWSLNASQSMDTEHDQKMLLFKWYLGEELIQNGGPVLDPSALTTPGEQTLRLVVTDDDGAQSELTFTMSIPADSVDASEGSLGGNIFTLVFVGMVSVALYLLVKMGASPPQDSLPKWQSKKNE